MQNLETKIKNETPYADIHDFSIYNALTIFHFIKTKHENE